MGNDKRKKAVALGYKAGVDTAPKVLASGGGLVAEKVIAIAKEHGIPIHKDCDLVEVLSGLDLDEEIPADLYTAIAEILAFIYKLNKDVTDKINR